MSQLEVVGKAKELGFDAIEFSTFMLPEGETNLSFATRVREECERLGLQVRNYAVSADFLNGSFGSLGAEVERLKEEVKVAEILNSPFMRHDVTWGLPKGEKGVRNFDDALPVLIKACRAVTEYAEQKGIKTMTENHGYFCQDSERIERLVAGVNHPNFGVLLDIGNFLCVDEDPGKAVGRLVPYVFHVHVKDFHIRSGELPDPGEGWFMNRGGNYLRGAIIGNGDVPVVQCIKIMKKAKYEGILSIEFEGLEDHLTGISIGANNLRNYVRSAFS